MNLVAVLDGVMVAVLLVFVAVIVWLTVDTIREGWNDPDAESVEEFAQTRRALDPDRPRFRRQG